MQRLIVIAPDNADLSPFYEALTAHQPKPKRELSEAERLERNKKARQRYATKRKQQV